MKYSKEQCDEMQRAWKSGRKLTARQADEELEKVKAELAAERKRK